MLLNNQLFLNSCLIIALIFASIVYHILKSRKKITITIALTERFGTIFFYSVVCFTGIIALIQLSYFYMENQVVAADARFYKLLQMILESR